MKIHLPIVPPKTTHQAKKIVRIGGFSRLADKPELTEVISDYMSILRPYAPDKPITGAVVLKLEFVFPWRKSEPKKNRVLGRRPMTSKPDWDNLAKTLVDVMTKLGFWVDDSQIFSGHPVKWWGDDVGITIEFEEWRGEQKP